MKHLYKLIKIANIRYAGYLLAICGVIVPLSVSQLLIMRATGSVLQMTLNNEFARIRAAFIYMALITIIKMVMNALFIYFSKTIQGKIEYMLRTGFITTIFHLKFSELQQRRSGDVLSLYTNDIGQTVELLSADTFSLLLDFLSTIVYGILMFWYQPVNTLIFFLLFPPLIFVQIKTSKPIQMRMKALSIKRGEYNGVILDSLKSLPTIKSYRLERIMEERFTKGYMVYFQEIVEYIWAFSILVTIGLSISAIPMIVAFAASAIAVINERLSIGDFVVYTTLAMTLNDWVLMLAQRFGRLRTKNAQADRVERAMDGMWEQAEEGKISLDKDSGFALSFLDVSAGYIPNEPVLNGISLHIRNGESVAVVGESGCGKTTICRLLLSFLEMEKGKIEIFGQDTTRMTAGKQRAYFSYVPQKQSMMMKTIAENISFSKGGALEQERLKEACRMADINQFIEALPQGYLTQVAEFAGNMSGGQSQRLALARAFYKDAPILLMDESTASLDVETEKQILQTILQVKGQKTILFITHRVNVLKNFDRILIMDGGKICGDGNFEKLLSENRAFQALYTKQGEEHA